MYKTLTLLMLTLSAVFAQQETSQGENQGRMNNQENFSTRQQRELNEIVQEKEALNTLYSCVQSASNMHGLHQCRQTHRQTMQQIKPKRGNRGSQGGNMQGNQSQGQGMSQPPQQSY